MKAIILDMYGVIIKESKGNFIPFVYRNFPGTQKSEILSRFSRAQRGEMSSDEFISALGFKNPGAAMCDYIENNLTLDPDFHAFAKKYNHLYKTALLSNDVSEWSSHISAYHGLDAYFSVKVISGDVGIRKPDREIFDIVLERLGLPAAECVYVDNSVKNLVTAHALGMDAVLFNRDGEIYGGKTVYSFAELGEMIGNQLLKARII